MYRRDDRDNYLRNLVDVRSRMMYIHTYPRIRTLGREGGGGGGGYSLGATGVLMLRF